MRNAMRLTSSPAKPLYAYEKDAPYPDWVVALPHVLLVYCDVCRRHVPDVAYHCNIRYDYVRVDRLVTIFSIWRVALL